MRTITELKPELRNRVIERFWREVLVKPGCWGWTGSKLKDGRGRIPVHGRSFLAYRISWEIHHGRIPAHLYVLHNCDNPECSNPEHLRLGTQQENMKEMQLKCRWGPKRKRGIYKIKPADAETIVFDMDRGIKANELARRFVVNPATIRRWYRRVKGANEQ